MQTQGRLKLNVGFPYIYHHMIRPNVKLRSSKIILKSVNVHVKGVRKEGCYFLCHKKTSTIFENNNNA